MYSAVGYTVLKNGKPETYSDIRSAMIAAHCDPTLIRVEEAKSPFIVDMSDVDEVFIIMRLMFPESRFSVYERVENFDSENIIAKDTLLIPSLSYAETIAWMLNYLPDLTVPMGIVQEKENGWLTAEFRFSVDSVDSARGWKDIVIKPTSA